jgi:hypothetical protein
MTQPTSNKIELGKGSTEQWFLAENTRPKLINVTFVRTTDGGYQVQEAAILNRVNQHSTKWVRADVRALARDVKRRGLFAK